MANEIVGVDGNASGNQLTGRAIVATGGRGSQTLFRKSLTLNGAKDIDIAGITDDYDDRWDDRTYYTDQDDADL